MKAVVYSADAAMDIIRVLDEISVVSARLSGNIRNLVKGGNRDYGQGIKRCGICYKERCRMY